MNQLLIKLISEGYTPCAVSRVRNGGANALVMNIPTKHTDIKIGTKFFVLEKEGRYILLEDEETVD